MYIKDRLFTEIREIREKARKRAEKHFLENGGCNACWGWGGHYYRTTMDDYGYDFEFSKCKNCNGEKNPCPGTSGNDNNGYIRRIEIELLPSEIKKIQGKEKEISEIEEMERNILSDKEVRKGSEVIVKKGRTAPIGFSGIVFWVGYNQFGQKLGIRNTNNEVAWTYTKNVEAIL